MSDQLSPSSKLETEQLLRQLNDDWTKALLRGDCETLRLIMAEDFLFAYPFEGDGREQFIDGVTAGEVRVEYINRENVSVRIWGNAAVLTGMDSVKWFYQGRDFSGHYKIMNVYSLRDETWQLVSVQACHIS